MERIQQIRNRYSAYADTHEDVSVNDFTNGFNVSRIYMELIHDGYLEQFAELASHAISDIPYLLDYIDKNMKK